MIGRSALFTPANVPNRINSVVAIQSDSMIFDLEDSVPPDEKDAARILLREALLDLDFLRTKNVLIRVNESTTGYFDEDIEELVRLGDYQLIIPKASVKGILAAAAKLSAIESKLGLDSQTSIVPLIETPSGVEQINEILRSSKRIVAVLFGAEDFRAEMGITRSREGEELMYARSRLSVAGHAAEIEVIDTPFTDLDDLDGLKAECCLARQLGFSGKQAIHPSQIDTIHRVFSPSASEISSAMKILKATEEAGKLGKGAFVVDGKMVDEPVIKRARMVLKKATISRQGSPND
jgi:citrate lyase subunit beta / citryl-CoA lyase